MQSTFTMTDTILRNCRAAAALMVVGLFAGCSAEPVHFRLNHEGKKLDELAPLNPGDLTDREKKQALEALGVTEFPKGEPLPGYLQARFLAERNQELVDTLDGLFGGPDTPYAYPGTGLDQRKLAEASGPTSSKNIVLRYVSKNDAGKPVEMVASGPLLMDGVSQVSIRDAKLGAILVDRKDIKDFSYQRGLFRQHCVHCHGITGDGDGPTAEFVMPYPRDFRKGKFKFTSTDTPDRPTRGDLHRTLMEGIPGTAMPSFRLLAQDELDSLIEYVAYLALRGEVETLITGRIRDNGEDLTDPEIQASIVSDDLLGMAGQWQNAEQKIVIPKERTPPTPEQLAASVEAGRKLFTSEKAQCSKCHGPIGSGDGWAQAKVWAGQPQPGTLGDLFTLPNELDDWNKDKVDGTGHIRPADIYFALPGQQVRPRNLRQGIYRGGRRPVDVYRRIAASIKGTAMPALGKTLTPDEIWNLVDFVRQLPFEDGSDEMPDTHSTATIQGQL